MTDSRVGLDGRDRNTFTNIMIYKLLCTILSCSVDEFSFRRHIPVLNRPVLIL